MPNRKTEEPQAFAGYKGILAKRLPFDPHWAAIGSFTDLRAIASINATASNAPQAAEADGDNTVPPNLFAPKFFPHDLEDRIAALYGAHGVDYGDDDALLFALVTTHVPGLAVESAAHGPARSWTPNQRAALKIAVDQHIADKAASRSRAISVAAACMHLERQSPWKSLLRARKDRARALRKQYDLAEDDWVQFVKVEQAHERWEREHPEEAAKRRKNRLRELLGCE